MGGGGQYPWSRDVSYFWEFVFGITKLGFEDFNRYYPCFKIFPSFTNYFLGFNGSSI